MTIRTFLAGIAAVTLICFASWLSVIIFTDPQEVGWIILTLFYFSLFLWVCGVFILSGFYLRSFLNPHKMPYIIMAIAVRQAILFSLALVVLLVLKGLKILNLINGTLLLISVISVEGYFLSNYDEHIRRNR